MKVKTRRAGSSWIRKDKRLAIYLRDKFCCTYCQRDLHGADPFDVTLDHLKPHVKGGSNKASNLVTACRTCNSSRQDKPLRTFASADAVRRAENQRRRKLAPYRELAKALIAGRTGSQAA